MLVVLVQQTPTLWIIVKLTLTGQQVTNGMARIDGGSTTDHNLVDNSNSDSQVAGWSTVGILPIDTNCGVAINVPYGVGVLTLRQLQFLERDLPLPRVLQSLEQSLPLIRV